MILEWLDADPETFEAATGWTLRPESACRGDECVPITWRGEGRVDVADLARQLGMPVVQDEGTGTWCVGPRSAGRALESARLPEIVLPDLEGRPFDLASLRGLKVLLVAWASW